MRFPPEIVDAVKARADSEGVTVSEWIRRTVAEAVTSQASKDDPAAIVEETRRDLDRLAATIT